MSSIDTLAGPSTRSESQPEPSEDAVPTARPDRWQGPRLGTIVIALVVVALALRLWELGERPFHHDESLDAWWSWLFRNGRYTNYDPVYHGPLRFYITAAFFELFGESEATARLFSAVTGAAVVGLPFFLRRELGRVGTIAASVALCISPTLLYYSRFGREDAQMVFLAMLTLVLGLAYLKHPRTVVACGLMFTLAASFAIKESTYLFGLMLAVYALIVVAAQFDAQQRARLHDLHNASATTPDGELNPLFFGTLVVLASIGLTAAVVVGNAADELFPMLALFGLAMTAITAITALPSLRAAGLHWPKTSWMASGAALVALGAAVVVWRLGGAPDASVADAGVGATSFVSGTTMGWVTLGLAAAGIGIGSTLLGTVKADNHSGTEISSSTLMRSLGGAALTAGLGFGANEWFQIQPERPVVWIAVPLVCFAVALLITFRPRVTNESFAWPASLRALGAIGMQGWALAFAVFAITWLVCFTIFFSVPQDWASGFTRAIEYWDSQQEVNRGGQPWNYYLYALPAYEWFFVAMAAIGTWRVLRRPTIAGGLFLWVALGSLILYSYAGERMPWLIAHPLLPILILAAWGAQVLWENRHRSAMPAIATIVGLGLLATTGISLRSSFPQGADSREILSQAGQATPHLTAVLERLENIDRIARHETGEPASLAISTSNAWPYSWYLRDRPNTNWFTVEAGPPPDVSYDVIIGDAVQGDPALFQLVPENYPDYQSTLFAMRSWWVPTYDDAGPIGWAKWVRSSELWEQDPNPNYVSISEPEPGESIGGVVGRLDQLRRGANSASTDLVSYLGARDSLAPPPDPALWSEPDDGRDGCGSVDQFMLVHNRYAFTEAQVYPGPIDAIGALPCASDSFVTS